MRKNELVNMLREQFPLFSKTNDNDDVYLLYGSFGSFIIDLINLRFLHGSHYRHYFYDDVKLMYQDINLIDEDIKRIYYFIDELYLSDDLEVIDVLNTCILEAIMGNEVCHELAKKYLSKKAYHHYEEITK